MKTENESNYPHLDKGCLSGVFVRIFMNESYQKTY